jgi:hypothetical protein
MSNSEFYNDPFTLKIHLDLYDMKKPGEETAEALRKLAGIIAVRNFDRDSLTRDPIVIRDATDNEIGYITIKWYID